MPIVRAPVEVTGMPALLARALALFGIGGAARAGVAAIARRPGAAALVGAGAGLAGFGAQQAISIGGDGFRPRRRRRRALTADDMRTALTIASAISKKAAENFVLQRTRR